MERYFKNNDEYSNKDFQFGNALANAISWLYSDDADFNERESYDMRGRIELWDLMNCILAIVIMAAKGNLARNTIDSFLRDVRDGWNPYQPPRIIYTENELKIDRLHYEDTVVMLWAAALYCAIRKETDKNVQKWGNAQTLLDKMLNEELVMVVGDPEKSELKKRTFVTKKHFVSMILAEPKRENEEDLAHFIMSVNNNPEQIEHLGERVAREGFEYDTLKIVFSFLDKSLMDKAILVITDKWEELVDQKDEHCYQVVGTMPGYGFDKYGMYEKNEPLKMLRYLDIERDLENIKKGELKRRKVEESFKKKQAAQTEKPRQASRAKNKDAKTKKSWFTKATFTINGMDEGNLKETCLELIANSLTAHFVKAISQDNKGQSINQKPLIIDLFTGTDINQKDALIWKGTKSELVYFFRELNRKRLLAWPKDEHFWSIVASHFKIKTEQKNGKVRMGKIAPQSLETYTCKPKDSSTKLLDAIIAYFDPDISNIISKQQNDPETEATNSRNQQMAENDYKNQLARERDKYKGRR